MNYTEKVILRNCKVTIKKNRFNQSIISFEIDLSKPLSTFYLLRLLIIVLEDISQVDDLYCLFIRIML